MRQCFLLVLSANSRPAPSSACLASILARILQYSNNVISHQQSYLYSFNTIRHQRSRHKHPSHPSPICLTGSILALRQSRRHPCHQVLCLYFRPLMPPDYPEDIFRTSSRHAENRSPNYTSLASSESRWDGRSRFLRRFYFCPPIHSILVHLYEWHWLRRLVDLLRHLQSCAGTNSRRLLCASGPNSTTCGVDGGTFMVGSFQSRAAEQDIAFWFTFLDLCRTFWSRTGRGGSTEEGLVG